MNPGAFSPWARRLAWGVLGVGLLLRVAPLVLEPDHPLHTCDGRAYWELARSLAHNGSFEIQDLTPFGRCNAVALGPSHHYSPFLPAIEAAFILVLGDNLFALTIPLVLLGWGAVLAVYWATRDLFDADAALLVAATVSVEWTGILFGTVRGYSENLVVITLALTFWSLLKSLRRESSIAWAGLFAGLGYLSKASVGWFFLISGFGGLAWRLRYHGLPVFRNRSYLLAIGVFGLLFGGWSLRNLYLFWDGRFAGLFVDWQSSAYTVESVAVAFGQPALLAAGFVVKGLVLTAGLAAGVLFLLPNIRLAASNWRDEAVSGLLLGVALLLFLGTLFAATFFVVEGKRLTWVDPVRYVTPAQVPLLWLAIGGWGPRPSPRQWAFLWAFSLLGCYLGPWMLRPGPPSFP